jgi:hypothetical protein
MLPFFAIILITFRKLDIRLLETPARCTTIIGSGRGFQDTNGRIGAGYDRGDIEL